MGRGLSEYQYLGFVLLDDFGVFAFFALLHERFCFGAARERHIRKRALAHGIDVYFCL